MMTRLFLALAVLLTASPALAQPAAERPIVLGSAFDLPSRAEDEVRRITVWLPPSYADGKQSYPVLYLLDGGEQQDLLPVVGLAALAGLNGVTDEVIVVGIESGPGLRVRDFTTPSETERKAYPTNGRAALFRRFLAEDLLPAIAARYRTSGETAIIGESLAGYFVLDTALRRPELFSTYIAVSPSLWWDDESLSREAASLLKRSWPAGRRLYVSRAADDGAEAAMARLTAALKAVEPGGPAWLYEAFPDERHRSTYHPAGLRALRWAFPGPEAVMPGGR
jgi:predicted alpha/beta superfamily hydrolase